MGKTALFLLSQSGETKDLYRCIKLCKNINILKVGIINVEKSLISRESDIVCYLKAGREVGVASTKSFTSQVILLSIIALWFNQEKKINIDKRIKHINDLKKINIDIKNTINNNTDKIDNLLNLFKQKNNCFVLGKDKSEAIAYEGALKIKEISYIHAEGYSSNSLKHGPFSLLDKNYPVILISPINKYYSKNINIYNEIKSRHAKIIFITDNKEINKPNSLIVENNHSYSDLLCILPLQLLAYKLGIYKGYNIDMPRNLAKVVTVE